LIIYVDNIDEIDAIRKTWKEKLTPSKEFYGTWLEEVIARGSIDMFCKWFYDMMKEFPDITLCIPALEIAEKFQDEGMIVSYLFDIS
jgi:hypothetical protein